LANIRSETVNPVLDASAPSGHRHSALSCRRARGSSFRPSGIDQRPRSENGAAVAPLKNLAGAGIQRLESRPVSMDAARVFAAFDEVGFRRTFAAALFAPGVGLALTPKLDRWLEAAATSFDCCRSQPISDPVNGWLTTENLSLDVGEAFESVTEFFLPKDLELIAMLFS
jgi:hypothetical protein